MKRFDSIEYVRQVVISRAGIVRPVIILMLALGLGVGLMKVYSSRDPGEMVSYKEYKEYIETKKKTPEKKTETRKSEPNTLLENEPRIHGETTYPIEEKIKSVLGSSNTPLALTMTRESLERVQKGIVLSEQGRFNLAELEFKKAAEISPKSAEVYAIWATALRMAKKYKGAERYFTKADQLAPNDNEILINWGISRLMAGEGQGAIDLIKRSLELEPNSPTAYNYLGKAYGRKKNYPAEEASYRKALELMPDFAQAHFNLAVVLSLQKSFDKAAKHFKRAIVLDPEFNKPFVQRFLAQYNQVEEIRQGKSLVPEQAEMKMEQAGKLERKISKKEKKPNEGSDHNMEGSGQVEKDFTYVRGKVSVNNKPIGSNAVVFMETKDKLRVPEQKTSNITIVQRNLKFEPQNSVVMKGSTITFLNQDKEVHNIYSKSINNQFNLGAMAAGASKTITIKDSGPIVLRCNMHKDMLGTLFVVPNGYYTQPTEDGSYEFPNAKSKEYFLQIWHPELLPSEVEAHIKSIRLMGKDAVFNFDIASRSKPGDINDLVDETDYNKVVDNIEKLLYEAIDSWKAGKKYKPRKQVLIAITKYFDGGGLKGAVAKSFSEKRSIKLEAKLDAIRKKISGLDKDASVTEVSLKQDIVMAISQLRLNVQELKVRMNPLAPQANIKIPE